MINAEIKREGGIAINSDLSAAFRHIGDYKQGKIKESIRAKFSDQQTGALAESTDYTFDESSIEWTVSAPYARIQQFGGRIKALTRVTVTHRFNPSGATLQEQRGAAFRKPFEIWQMARMFFAKFMQTGDKKFFAMFLWVKKYGYVDIKGKHYIDWTEEEIEYITKYLGQYITSSLTFSEAQ